MGTPTRILVVDDSATIRAVLRRIIGAADGLEVAGEALDGAEAVAAVEELRPDVVLMDVEMPVMDGFAATEAIMQSRPTPILVVTSRREMQVGFEALRRGALEVIPKPESPAGWRELAESLPRAIRAVVGTGPLPAMSATAGSHGADVVSRRIRVVAIGASTGGPAAIRSFLEHCPADAGFGVVVVQHIAPSFEQGLAEWLAGVRGWNVAVARDGEVVAPGTVRIGAAGHHLLLQPGFCLRLDDARPPQNGHRPSIDELFDSCSRSHPQECVGILLTGMGRDGAAGLVRLRESGGLTLVQDEASSIVFGMPRIALELGATDLALPPDRLAALVARVAQGGEP